MSLKPFLLGPREIWSEITSTIQPSPPPAFPKFPTVADLLNPEGSSLVPSQIGTVPERRNGMFDLLLQGKPEQLLLEVQKDPARYHPRTEELLTRLIQGDKMDDLFEGDMDILDQSALESAQAPPPRREEAPVETAPRREVSATPESEEEESPEEDLPPYWWL